MIHTSQSPVLSSDVKIILEYLDLLPEQFYWQVADVDFGCNVFTYIQP